ncbi:MAG: lipid-A-disaccharide synthase [Syntrophothermus sp.]
MSAAKRLKVMLVAGEASGDLHGSFVAKKIWEMEPSAEIYGMGGHRMRIAGVHLLFDPTRRSTIGFIEALAAVPLMKKILARMEKEFDLHRPDVIVLIDFPGFNMRVAEMAKQKGIPVVYYFSPSAWAWGRKRAEKVAATATMVVSVFPFEAQVYREAGANVTYVGHPLVDIVEPTMTREEARRFLAMPMARKLVALMPGSRRREVRLLLPGMLAAAKLIRKKVPGTEFVLPLAPTITYHEVEPLLKQSGVPVRAISQLTYDAMQACDMALIASGTATLEAACLGLPMVIVYKVSALTYRVGKLLVKIPYIGLPNIVAGRVVVPELLQDDATPERIAEEAEDILLEPGRADKVREALREVVSRLGEPGVLERVAGLILGIARDNDAPRAGNEQA